MLRRRISFWIRRRRRRVMLFCSAEISSLLWAAFGNAYGVPAGDFGCGESETFGGLGAPAAVFRGARLWGPLPGQRRHLRLLAPLGPAEIYVLWLW